MRILVIFFLFFGLVSVSTPSAKAQSTYSNRSYTTRTYTPATRTVQPYQSVPQSPSYTSPSSFKFLPYWDEHNPMPALYAMQKSCALLADRNDNAPMSDKARWAGTVADWRAVCGSLEQAPLDKASVRKIIETLMSPVRLDSPDRTSRLTGYFEPTYEVRRYPSGAYTEPVPGVPNDLVKSGSQVYQVLANGRRRAYPPRAQINTSSLPAIAYAKPADVFFLQIQGSGRLRFPDGQDIRAAFAAHNNHTFRSTANYLTSSGRISAADANMDGIRRWMETASPYDVRAAMNHNPRFVFFKELPIGDMRDGPKGAQGIPLTGMGSLAVDTSIYPLGAPFFVNTNSPSLGGNWSGLLVSQDTGGAIKGVVRGDIYFGTGPDAGSRAGSMNSPGTMWILLPRRVAERMQNSAVSTETYSQLSGRTY